MNSIPYIHQIKGARAVTRFNGRALIADEMGTGKSFQALLYAVRHPEIRPIIIVCPASLKYNWQHECSYHCGIKAEILETTKPPKHGFDLSNQVVIINYDILGPWMDYLKKIKAMLIIFDESHYLISRYSKRSRMARMLSRKIPNALALTGTPLLNRPAELWTTLNILRPDLFPSFQPFGEEYCSPKVTPWGVQYKGAVRLKKLHRILSENLMIRRKKEEVLTDLPSKQRIITTLPLSNPREYNHALNDFLGWLKKTRPEKVRKAEKAEQVVKLGYLKRLAGTLKLPAVIEWISNFLQESDSKLVVMAIHQEVIKRLQSKFSGICVVVDGKVKKEDRHLAVHKFQNDKRIRIFIGNLKAAGVGINLTAASTVALVELGWSPGEHLQGEDRAHRIGSKKDVKIFYLVAKDTIEVKLLKLLQEKQKILDSVLDNGKVKDDFDIFDKLSKELENAI